MGKIDQRDCFPAAHDPNLKVISYPNGRMRLFLQSSGFTVANDRTKDTQVEVGM